MAVSDTTASHPTTGTSRQAPANTGGDGVVWSALDTWIDQQIKAHKNARDLDSVLYNGGTVLTLLATTTVALLPDESTIPVGGVQISVPKLLTVLATFLVAIERALAFGARWRFHLRMWSGYSTVKAMIAFQRILPSAGDLEDIRRRLSDLAAQEDGVPGNGQTSSAAGAASNPGAPAGGARV
jgi:hypothetical protein